MNYAAPRPAVIFVALLFAAVPQMSHADDETPASSSPPAAADALGGPRVGSRVRVTASSPAFTGSIIGTLVSLTGEKLIILDPKSGAVSELPVDSVRRMEVSHPRHRGRTGALIGIGLGFGAVAVAGSGYSEVGCGQAGGPYVDCEAAPAGEVLAVGAFAAAMYGGLGYWIGKRSKVDVWSDAPLGGLRFSVQPLKKGGRFALTFSF